MPFCGGWIDNYGGIIVGFDINDPKVRWAQEIADKTGEKQVIVENEIGGYSIKPQWSVPLQCPSIKVFIEPKRNRRPEEQESGVISEPRTTRSRAR